jgi:soluble lytic murein transglycosylase-like protein
MTHRVVHVLVLLLLVGTSINAQQRADFSIKQRAQSLEPYFVDSAKRYGIDPRILRVLCYLESRFQLTAISPKGARGPMQFMPDTAARYGLNNPHDPKAAIDAAARYFRDLLRRFDGRIDLAFAAYNAGEGAVEAFIKGRSLRLSNGRIINPRKIITGGIPPYSETRDYVSSVMRLLDVTTKSFNLSTIGRPASTRDFTIDVITIGSTPSQLSEKPETVFIEIP